jgi:hypothetical protein
MKRAQLELAAKLYSLATMAHLDLGDDETDDEGGKVKSLAAKRARTKLNNLGVDRHEIITLDDAMDKAREMRP